MDLLHEREFADAGRRPRKVDCMGVSMAGDVTVVMAVSWSHEGGEE
jgi:hypothetical protein